MRAKLKYFSIVLVVILCAGTLIAGALLWITRPISFSSIFPISSENISLCHVALHTLHDNTPEGGQFDTLTYEQTQSLLQHLSSTQYRMDIPACLFSSNAIRLTMSPYARLTFVGQDGTFVEFLLAGDLVRVNLTSSTGTRTYLYRPEGEQAFQEATVVYLQSCLAQNKENSISKAFSVKAEVK